jgi:hypothetical protein
MTLLSVDFKKLEVFEKYTIDESEINDLLVDYDGSFSIDQSVNFTQGDSDISVDYKMNVDGVVKYHSGDYFNPSYTDVYVKNIDIDITSVDIDGEKYEPSEDITKIIIDKIKSECY